MTNIRVLKTSFNGGIITPEFFGRVTDPKLQAGVEIADNFMIAPHGPAMNRGGTKFVKATKYADKTTRVITFTYSTDDLNGGPQTYCMEVGHEYIRFHTLGATLEPSESTTTYSGATAYVVGDIVEDGGAFFYCIQDSTGNATSDTDYWYAMPIDGIIEIPTSYDSEDVMDLHFVQSNDVLSLTHPSYPPAELRRVIPSANTPYSFILADIQFVSELDAPTGVTAVATVGSGSTTYSYKVSAVADGGVEESLPSAAATCTNDLLTSGNYNTISWNAVTGASRYNVYLLDNGLYGFIGQTDQLSLKDENIEADISNTPPIQDDPFDSTDNYPSEVSYYEQRRVFAGTNLKPQNFWMTRAGTESNLSYSIPYKDEDAVRFRIAAREANRIRHAVPMADLILLTASTEWRLTSINTDAVTPTSVSIKPQSYVGSANVRPLIMNNNVLFVAARGGHWRELAYNDGAGGYVTGDLSLRAPHLFDGFTTGDWAASKEPFPVVWGTLSNGTLIGMTYVPEQQVGAFHTHTSYTEAGKSSYKSVTVVPEGNYDPFYAVVEREINGSVVQYIERYEPRVFEERENAFFVDCGLTFTNRVAITGVSNANPAVVTTDSAHGFSNGDQVDLRGIVSSESDTATHLDTLNGVRYKVANVTSTTFELQTDEDTPVDVDTTGWTAYKRGGYVYDVVTTISGLDHLEGETVNILANGSVEAQKVVASGSITLDYPASIVHIGLPIVADLLTPPLAFEGDSALGQGLDKNINKIWLRVYRSAGVSAGPDFDNLTEYKPRSNEDYGTPPDLKSEELDPIILDNDWSSSGALAIRQSDPLPLTIASVTMEVAIGG